MSHEYILDIGIGYGGRYISRSGERRIGVDIDREVLSRLRRNYPEVIPLFSSAEHLPFAAHTFSRIDIVFPCDALAIPGLQYSHFALPQSWKTNLHGWYAEFHRVLNSHGELRIYGDLWVDPVEVEKTAKEFFILDSLQSLTIDDINTLYTETTQAIVDIYRDKYVPELDQYWHETLKLLTLKNT